MAAAWLITLPAAALVGGATWWLAHGIGLLVGDLAGVLAAFAVLLALSGYIFAQSRKAPVHSGNVNADWDEETNSLTPAGNAENTAQKKEAVS